MFDAIAQVLAGFYALPVIGGSYGVAIILLTIAVMVLAMPLTLKATRSTIKMQMVQPELKRLQKEYKDDRVKMNEELMALYKQHDINPVGGCLPIVAQLPIFLVLFNVLRGLTRRVSEAPWFEAGNLVRQQAGLQPLQGDTFSPRYLNHDTQMYQSMTSDTEMRFAGVFDLALHPLDVLRDNFIQAIPYVLLIVFVVATAYYQQRQITTRRGSNIQMTSQQQLLLRILPLFTGVWSFVFPTGLVVYWATSNVFRIGQQAYITRRLYSGEDSPGRRALEATADKSDDKTPDDKTPGDAGKKKPSASKPTDKTRAGAPDSSRRDSNGAGTADSDGKRPRKPRSERWSRERAATSSMAASSKSQQAPTSGRVTPKGNTSTSRKKKRKR
jgi:YidC/Oxa1 family membrane protein insertase